MEAQSAESSLDALLYEALQGAFGLERFKIGQLEAMRRVLGEDPDLDAPKHALLRTGVERLRASRPDWSRIA